MECVAVDQVGGPTGRGEMPGRLEVLSSLSRSDSHLCGRTGGQTLRLSLAPPRRPEHGARVGRCGMMEREATPQDDGPHPKPEREP